MFYFISFCRNILRLSVHVIVVRKKALRQATCYLRNIEQKFSDKFDEATFNKITKSYSSWLPTVTNSFARLHGSYASKAEQERTIHYFICSSVFDNFFDDKLLTVQQIENITFNYQHYQPKTFSEKASLYSHLFLLNYIARKDEYLSVLRKEFNAQVASLNQFNQNINNEEIQFITFQKGGNAVLMCYYYTDVEGSAEEKNCWFTLGTLIQLTNDLFDIYKDLHDGIETLATRCFEVYELEKIFLRQVKILKENIKLLHNTKKQQQNFSTAISSLYVMGFIALDNLKKIQAQHNNQLPNLKTLPRKELIVDMAKLLNIYEGIKYAYKIARI